MRDPFLVIPLRREWRKENTMAAQPQERVRKRLVGFSPLFLIVALSAPVLQGISCSPATGDATLSTLEVEVLGQNHISAFDSDQRMYNVWLPLNADTAIVRVYSTDPNSEPWGIA